MTSNTNPFFSLKTTQQENEFIRFRYEEDRRKRIVNGLLPSSMSRYLVELILAQLSSTKEGLQDG